MKTPTGQCTAKAKSTGNRCARRPIAGGTVCSVHGGAAFQVKRAAKLRLLDLVDPALGELYRILHRMPGQEITAAHSIQAARTVLEHTKDADQLNINLHGTVTQVDPKVLEAMTTAELTELQRLYRKALGQGEPEAESAG